MQRTGLLGVALLGLAVGSGCRSTCNDRCGLVRNDNLASRNAPREPSCAPCTTGIPTSYGHPVTGIPDSTMPAMGFAPDAGISYPGGGFPVYPGGEPLPIRPSTGPGTVAPPNELPYPNIPAPGVPESPAQPMPAIPPSTTSLPGSSAHTTGEIRKAK